MATTLRMGQSFHERAVEVKRGRPADLKAANPPVQAVEGQKESKPQGFLFQWNFFRVVLSHLIVSSLVGGGIIKALSPNLRYMDCLFLAASAVTSSGLGTVSMLDIDPGAFGMLFVLMFIGSSLFIQLAVLIFRRIKFALLRRQLVRYMEMVLEASSHDWPIVSTGELQGVIKRKDLEDRAAGVVAVAIVLHMTLFLGVSSFVLYGIDSTLYPPDEEVDGRGFTRLWNSVFLVMTSFTNCGITLGSANLVPYALKPGVYLFLCIMILVGNTCAPIVLRGIIWVMHMCASALRMDTDSLAYVLNQPRSVAYLLFDSRQTFVLFLITFAINVAEYVFFLGSTMNRGEIQPVFPDKATLAGMGVFQTISTRNAGLQILDLRLLNRGMLFVYIICMYMSSAPLVRTMYVSEQTERSEPAESDNADKDTESHLTRNTTVKVIMDFQKNFLFTHTAWIIFFILVLAFSEDEGVTTSGSSNENLFDVFFEVISAYGNVGISMGYPGVPYSLSGRFSDLGKIVIIVAMLMGKVRGLPTYSDMVVDFSFNALHVALLRSKEQLFGVQDRHASLDPQPAVSSRVGTTRRYKVELGQFARTPSFNNVLALIPSEIAGPAAVKSILSQAVFHPSDYDNHHSKSVPGLSHQQSDKEPRAHYEAAPLQYRPEVRSLCTAPVPHPPVLPTSPPLPYLHFQGMGGIC